MTLSLILDILVSFLLIVTIIFAVNLNRKLNVIRRDKSKLEALGSRFHRSAVHAEQSVGQVKQAITELNTVFSRSEGLREDLLFLMEKANKSADRLETAVRAVPKTGRPFGEQRHWHDP